MARTEIVPPFDIAQFPSPLAGFRKYTEPNDAKLYDTELMRVTGAPAGTPLRFATLDYYDGGRLGRRRAGRASTRPRPGTAFQQVGERVSATGRRQAGHPPGHHPRGRLLRRVAAHGRPGDRA